MTSFAAERRPVVDLTEAQARRSLVLKWGTVPEDVIPAWVAEMDYALDPVVQEAVLRAVRDGMAGYRSTATPRSSARPTPALRTGTTRPRSSPSG
jgi:bifunctional pyridoxal-dependent enzyme with beta-cystathionase and maltose regulon repressor activities